MYNIYCGRLNCRDFGAFARHTGPQCFLSLHTFHVKGSVPFPSNVVKFENGRRFQVSDGLLGRSQMADEVF